MSFGVRYQLDRDVVYARIFSECPVGELWQLLVIAAGKIRSNLPDVLLHDVRVIEEPLAGRTDVDPSLGRVRETIVYFIKNFPAVVESK